LKSVYDTEKIPLKAKVKGERTTMAKIKEVKFIVTATKNGTQADESPVTAPVQVGFPESSAELNYTPKPVDDALDYYDLRYKAEITPPGKSPLTEDGEEEFRVWPDKVEVTFTADDGEAHKKAKFRVVKGGKDSPVKTAGDDGKWSERVGQAEFTIKAEPPYELVDPVTHKGRKRSYKIKKNAYKVEFVSPTPAKETYKQYVNLDPDPGGWTKDKAYGNQMSFTVGAEGDTGRAAGARFGKQGDLVYIEVNFTPQTKRNDPQPQLLAEGLDGAPTDSNDKKTWKGKIKLGANGQATFKVELGHAGGDVCEVKVGADNTCGDTWVKFENWRRLFYELMYPDFMAPDLKDIGGGKHDFKDDIKSKVDARLAAAKIEYVCAASRKFTKAQAKPGTVVTGEYLGEPGRDRLILGGRLSEDDPVAFGAANDRTIHVSMADRTVSTGGEMKAERPQVDKAAFEFSNTKFFVPLEVDVSGCEWEAQIANPATYHKNPTIEFTTEDTMDVANRPYVITVEETQQHKRLDLTFARGQGGEAATTLEATETAKIEPFIVSLLGANDLRKFANKIKLKIGRPTRTPADTTRFNLVKGALQTSFDTKKQPIYTHPGLNVDGTKRKGPVDAAWFKPMELKKLKIELPTSAGGAQALPGDLADAAESDTQCPIKVSFQVYSTYAINGNSGGGRQLFQLRPAPRTPGSMASTLCHELGHAMGMTIMAGRSKVPPGLDPALHVDSAPTKGPYYENGTPPNGKRNIGVGGHCGTGVPQADWADAKFNGKSGTCVMFHSGGDADSRPSYCPTCETYLKGRRLTNIRSGWSGRDAAEY
jgi:hypothetical protein